MLRLISLQPSGGAAAADGIWPRYVGIYTRVQYAAMPAIYLVLVTIVLKHANASLADGVDGHRVCWVSDRYRVAAARPDRVGFLAPPAFSAVYLAPSVLAARIGGMPLVFGMTLFAGIVEVSFALVLNRLRVVITPVLSGLTVFVVGLQLGVGGIGETLDVIHVHLPAFPLHRCHVSYALSLCWPCIWGRGIVKLVCSLSGLVGWDDSGSCHQVN
jgi:xanthine permease XanP